MIDGMRCTGRTTRMLEAAYIAFLEGKEILIIAATQHQKGILYNQFRNMIFQDCWTPLERVHFRAGYDFDSIAQQFSQGRSDDIVVFIDHFAMESAVRWLPGWRNQQLMVENSELKRRLEKISTIATS